MTKMQVSILLAVCITVVVSLRVFAQPSGQLNIMLGEQRVVGEVIHLDDTHRVAHARAGFVRGSEAVYINGLRMCRGRHYKVDPRPGHIILTLRGYQHSDLIIMDYTRR